MSRVLSRLSAYAVLAAAVAVLLPLPSAFAQWKGTISWTAFEGKGSCPSADTAARRPATSRTMYWYRYIN